MALSGASQKIVERGGHVLGSRRMLTDAARRCLVAALGLLQCHTAEFVPSQTVVDPRITSVKPSTVCDGKGLFAAEDLPADALLSLYPVHALGVDDADGQIELVASAEDMRTHFDAIDKSEYRVYCRHAAEGDEKSALSIDVNPQRELVPGWCAHFVNDASACDSREPKDVERYLEQSVGGANCALVPVGRAPLTACVTTRPVAAGDELFLSYGPTYWVGGPPVESTDCTSPRRASSSDVLDASFWSERGGPRTAALLEASADVQRAAELAVWAEHAPACIALDEGLAEALECVRGILDAPPDAER